MPTSMPFSFTTPADLSIRTLILNLVLDAVLALVLAWHFQRYGRTMSNRVALARTIPFISLTTVLIISVVKSSLALSLGLVGALSIVRFRTPIKEPEELAYLFLAIAMGLGFGADQRYAVIAAFVIILAILTIRSMWTRRAKAHNLYLNIEAPDRPDEEATYAMVMQSIGEHVEVADLRRLDVRDNMLYATFYIDCEDDHALVAAMDNLKRNLPGVAVSFVEQDPFLGV